MINVWLREYNQILRNSEENGIRKGVGRYKGVKMAIFQGIQGKLGTE